MKEKQHKEELEIPNGIEVRYEDGNMVVKAENVELKKTLKHPKVKISIENKKIIFITEKFTKKEKRLVNTFISHTKNMFAGLKEKFVYKMKICSGHFPMNVSCSKNELIVKNFIGEKTPRVLEIMPGVDVKVEGDAITVESNNKELAGQTAGDIEQLTRRPGFDKRIYQEGIYIIKKPGKKLV